MLKCMKCMVVLCFSVWSNRVVVVSYLFPNSEDGSSRHIAVNIGRSVQGVKRHAVLSCALIVICNP